MTIATLRMSARSSSAGGGAAAEGSASGVVVDGVAVAAGPGTRVEVAGIGTLVFLEQVSDGGGGVRANGVRLEVTDPQAAVVIGQPFVLGHLDLVATQGHRPGGDRARPGARRPARDARPPAADPAPAPAPAPSRPRPRPSRRSPRRHPSACRAAPRPR